MTYNKINITKLSFNKNIYILQLSQKTNRQTKYIGYSSIQRISQNLSVTILESSRENHVPQNDANIITDEQTHTSKYPNSTIKIRLY